MADLNLTTFSPATTIRSDEVNSNFNAVQTRENAKRPTMYMTVQGTLAATSNVGGTRLRIKQPLLFNGIDLDVTTAPLGQEIIIDIKKNGGSIFSTRPQIAAGSTSGGAGAVFSVQSVQDGDILTIDIIQSGLTVAGEDLTIALSFKY